MDFLFSCSSQARKYCLIRFCLTVTYLGEVRRRRTLPVEFDVPKSIHIHSEIEILENFELIQHPQPAQEKLSSGALSFNIQ